MEKINSSILPSLPGSRKNEAKINDTVENILVNFSETFINIGKRLRD